MDSEKLSKKIIQLIFEKKGEDVKRIELTDVSSVADYFIICSASSDTQVGAIAEHIDKSLRDEGIRVWHKEGTRVMHWVLLDYVDVVVHIFLNETRAYYNLEKLWGDAPCVEFKDEPVKPKRTKKKA